MNNHRTGEQWKATKACVKCLCTKVQRSALMNRGLRMRTSSLSYQAAYVTGTLTLECSTHILYEIKIIL